MSTKKQQAQNTKNSSSLAKASGVDLTKSLSTITQSSLQVQKTFSDISNDLITKAAELEAVTEAIRLKKEEMQTLHGVDSVLLTLDEARAQHAKALEDNAKEIAALNEQHNYLMADLETARKREQENYDYLLQQRRKAEQDAWNEKIRIAKVNENVRMEQFEKDIAQREEALKAREQQYNDAILKAQMYEDDLKKAVAREVAIVTNTMKKDFEHEKQLTAVQNASANEKLAYDNKRMVETANNLEAQVKELQQKLEAAYAKNAELATKAVEGASNKQAQADALALVTNIGGGNNQRPRS